MHVSLGVSAMLIHPVQVTLLGKDSRRESEALRSGAKGLPGTALSLGSSPVGPPGRRGPLSQRGEGASTRLCFTRGSASAFFMLPLRGFRAEEAEMASCWHKKSEINSKPGK